MHDVKGQYETRLKEVGDLLGTPEGTEGPMMQEAKKFNDGSMLVTVMMMPLKVLPPLPSPVSPTPET